MHTIKLSDAEDTRKRVKQCPECAQQYGADAAFCPFDGTKLVAGTWDPAGDKLLGHIIDGRYEVTDVLGEGGMGKVYRVRHTSLDRPFALKALRPELSRDENLAERFIQEARATASVRHPHVVSITDFGALPDGTPYFTMELLLGTTLGEVIKAGGPLPAARAVTVLRQVASALGAAHEAGVVHRDLKPDNVFLVGGIASGSVSENVKVVDFGAAKVMGASRLTKTGIVFGTPHYMSPEQASGEPVDHRADIYALGVIMYEMFTGRVPFEGDTYMGVLTQHMFVKPLPPSKVCPAARELGALEEITLRALEKKPDDRYASMADLIADVDSVVQVRASGKMRISHRVERPSHHPKSGKSGRLADELEPPTLEELRIALEGNEIPTSSRTGLWIGVGAVASLAAGLAAFAVTQSASSDGVATSASAASIAPIASSSPLASAVAAPAPSQSAAVVKKSVLVTATPAARVVEGGVEIGTTPMRVTRATGASPRRFTLRAQGYADEEVLLDDAALADLQVELKRLAPSPVAPPAARPAGATPALHTPHTPPPVDDDPWAKKRP